jgi:hypothetical protein
VLYDGENADAVRLLVTTTVDAVLKLYVVAEVSIKLCAPKRTGIPVAVPIEFWLITTVVPEIEDTTVPAGT